MDQSRSRLGDPGSGPGEQDGVVAFDSNVVSVGMLETGEVDALIVQNPCAMGYLGVETAANLMNGQTGGPSVVDTATTIVTRENMYEPESQKILFSFEERKWLIQKPHSAKPLFQSDNDKQSVNEYVMQSMNKICTE